MDGLYFMHVIFINSLSNQLYSHSPQRCKEIGEGPTLIPCSGADALITGDNHWLCVSGMPPPVCLDLGQGNCLQPQCNTMVYIYLVSEGQHLIISMIVSYIYIYNIYI